MSKLKERMAGFGRKRWLLLGLNAALILISLACWVGLHVVSTTLQTAGAAVRFRGDSDVRFAQLACYLPVGQGRQVEDILSFRSSLDSKFVEQSLEAPEGGSLYIDAYSGSAQVSVTTDHGSVSVRATGVGGDFFQFHPLTLRSGSYIAERDLMDDLVVLDEVLAWRLFGGMDLTGMTVYISGQPFVVSGVIAVEEDFASRKANRQEGALYMSYSALHKLREDLTIDCYEIVLPDPITGYARSLVEGSFPVGEGDLVENSARYTLSHLWQVVGSYGQRSMRTNGVIYPYWENALRLTEDYAALLLVLAVLFALCPAVTALVLGVGGIRRSWRWLKTALPAKWEAAVEKHREHKLAVELEKLEEE